LSTEEFKLKKQQQFLQEEQSELKQDELKLKEKQRALDNVLKGADNVLNQLGYFNTIETKKTLIGGKITLTEKDFKKLEAFAQQGTMYHELMFKYEKLEKEHQDLKKKAETSIADRLKWSKEISDSKNRYNVLVRQYNSIYDSKEEILDFLKENDLLKNLQEYQHEKMELEKEQQNSHDWDMEM
jgi:DNA repair exonuclease SbcCD ATPase subunit